MEDLASGGMRITLKTPTYQCQWPAQSWEDDDRGERTSLTVFPVIDYFWYGLQISITLSHPNHYLFSTSDRHQLYERYTLCLL
jgi:hypothetical protein